MMNTIYMLDIFSGESLSKWINEKGLSLCDYLIKILIAIVLYVIASKILKKITNLVQSSLDKKNVDQIASHFILNRGSLAFNFCQLLNLNTFFEEPRRTCWPLIEAILLENFS